MRPLLVVVEPLVVAAAYLSPFRHPSSKLPLPQPQPQSSCCRRLDWSSSFSSFSLSSESEEECKGARRWLDPPPAPPPPPSAAAAAAAPNDSKDEEKRHGATKEDDDPRRRRLLLLSAAATSVIVTTATTPIGGSAQQEESTTSADNSSSSSSQSSTSSTTQPPQTLPRNFSIVRDPQTYEAVVYVPPPPPPTTSPSTTDGERTTESTPPPRQQRLPLLIVLHGAGLNRQDAATAFLSAGDGEHAYLAPYLLASGAAPAALADHFVVAAPYVGGPGQQQQQRSSFYAEPRSKLLQFVTWMTAPQQPWVRDRTIDPSLPPVLFGFSDGATVAVELATSRRFAAVAAAAYGYSGASLPARALERLRGIPVWVFHSADDAVFPVTYGDRLAAALRGANRGDDDDDGSIVRYTRYKEDPAGRFASAASLRGHVGVGLAASQLPELYTWFLTQTLKQRQRTTTTTAAGVE